MNKNETVKNMAKILCPKGTANCEKCSKDYKCNVNFSQLSQLFDGGCRILDDEGGECPCINLNLQKSLDEQ
jgi:6-phosphogluconate dehydrogenase